MERFSKGEMRGWVEEGLAEALSPFLLEDHPSAVQEGQREVLKDSRLRWAAVLTLEDGRRIFLKKSRTKGAFEVLRHLFLSSKAKKEWELAGRAQGMGLPVPQPLGWIERRRFGLLQESIYLSEAVKPGTLTAEEVLKGASADWIETFARAVRAIHDRGLCHLDLHAGNMLWDGERFLLVDLHRGKILRRLSWMQRLENIAQIFHSLRSSWGERERSLFLRCYLGEDPFSTEDGKEGLRRISVLMDRLQERQWRSRTKRCLKESTAFTLLKAGDRRGYHQRALSAETVQSLIERHEHFVKERTNELVKDAPEVSVTLFRHGGRRIAVKAFRNPRWRERIKNRFRRPKGLRAWVVGNGLRVRGLPCPEPLAYVEKRGLIGVKEAFLIMEAPEGAREMDRYLFTTFLGPRERRTFVRAFARWLSGLHRIGVYHRDMKACNLLVYEGEKEGWRFLPLDLEDVSFDMRVDEERVFRNFLQLNTSVPGRVLTWDRLRFFVEYLKRNPVVRERKAFLRRLTDESRRRGVVYVSPGGVVAEKFPSPP